MNSFRIKAVNGETFYCQAEFEGPHDFAERLRSEGFVVCTRYQMGRSGPMGEHEVAVMTPYVGTIEIGVAS